MTYVPTATGQRAVYIPGPVDFLRPGHNYRTEYIANWDDRDSSPSHLAITSGDNTAVENYSPFHNNEAQPTDGTAFLYGERTTGTFHASNTGGGQEYLASVHYEQRVYPQYIMRHAYTNIDSGYHAYDNPSSSISSASTSTNPRTPSRHFYHRRTPSSLSNASTNSSSMNPSFRLDDDGDSSYSTPTHRSGHYDPLGGPHPPPRLSRQSSQEPQDKLDRPGTLELPRQHRSYRKNYFGRSSPKMRCERSGSAGSGGGTPTNTTPPDSMTSEDSSYVSATDMYSAGSGSGHHTTVSTGLSRVKFSPALGLTNALGEYIRPTLLDQPVDGQDFDRTIPLKAHRNNTKHRDKSNTWTPFEDSTDHKL